MVCPHLCIIYFFHSLPLNHSLLYWQSRHLFKISKHGALSNPIWLFHSWCCTSEPDPTNLLRDSTEQTSSKKLSTHSWDFFGWLVGWSVLWLTSLIVFFLVQVPPPQLSMFPQCSGKDKMKSQGPGQNLNSSTREVCWPADVQLTTAPGEVRKRWSAVGKTSCHA